MKRAITICGTAIVAVLVTGQAPVMAQTPPAPADAATTPQPKEVMQSVQVLRNKAKQTGNLKTTKEVTVKEEPAPAGSPAPQTIIIESPNPEVVYVPTYNPTVVYGTWAYPAYPPYPNYP